MALPVLFFFALIAVKSDQTPLRTGCNADDEVVASLPTGTPVEIDAASPGTTKCIGISALVGGKDVWGYVEASAITGTNAAGVGSIGQNQYVVHSADPAVARAGQLLNSNQPSQTLEVLQPAIQRHPRDASVLMLAGLAAYRSDRLPAALGYWRQSLDLAPNDALNAIYEDAIREVAADHSSDKLYSAHITLRYEGSAMPAETAQAIVAALEDDYSRISAQLGCTANEPIIAIVQSREQYIRGTSAAEWSGGHYDGRIHIAWRSGSDTAPRLQRALAHELVHACLMSLPSGSYPWPAWLQEGLAQKLSGDTLPPSAREQLRQLAAKHAIPRLENLGLDWFSMPKQAAVSAYNLALEAADDLYAEYTGDGVRKILSNPESIALITVSLDAKLGL